MICTCIVKLQKNQQFNNNLLQCVFSESCFQKVDLIFAVDITWCEGDDWEDCAALG